MPTTSAPLAALRAAVSAAIAAGAPVYEEQPAAFVELATGAPVALVCVEHLAGAEPPAGAILTRCTEHEAAAVIPAQLVAALAEDGRRAYLADELAAPAMSTVVRDALEEIDPPVGDPRTLAILQAYSAGYEAERAAELRRLGFGD